MQSDFERRMAQDVVEAVEARWRRKHDQELILLRRKRRKNLFVFGGFALLGVVGLLAWQYSQGELSVAAIDMSSCSSVLRRLFGESSDASMRTSYAALLRSVLTRPVKLLSDLPSEDSPTRAAAGTSFPVLSISGDGDFALYRLQADGKGGLTAVRCSPLGKEREMNLATFKSECRKPYLVGIGDTVYLCGSKCVNDAKNIKAQVCAVLGMPLPDCHPSAH